MTRVFDFSHFPTLDTDRLHLREMTPADVSALLKHLGNPEVVKYIDMQPIKTPEQAAEWLKLMGDYFSARDGLRWGVVLKQGDVFIGSAGIRGWNREARFAEIAFDLMEAYWGQGYATEVAQALIEFGFGQMNLNRIEADVLGGKESSTHVLEKLGFTREGVLRERLYKGGQYYDVYLYSLLRKDDLTHEA